MSGIPAPTATAAGDGSTNAKKLKRRSLLPQFARKTASEETAVSVRDAVPEAGEESDGVAHSPVSQGFGDGGDGGRREGERKGMPLPSLKSKLGRPRPVSMMPAAGAQPSRVEAIRAHARGLSQDVNMHADTARSQSLSALTGAGPEAEAEASSNTAPPSSRAAQAPKAPQPPQPPQPARPNVPSRTTSARSGDGAGGAKSASRRPTSMFGFGRAETASTRTAKGKTGDSHARTESSSTATSNGTSAASDKQSSTSHPRAQSIDTSSIVNRTGRTGSSPTKRSPTSPPGASAMSRARPTSMMPAPTTAKPAFNTYQQHYSPAKSALPKPPVPSARTSSAKPTAAAGQGDEGEDATIDLDTAKQQIELLQLSLLLQQSSTASESFATSARHALGQSHGSLTRSYEDVRAAEMGQQRLTNLAALEGWCGEQNLLVENLQILSMVYSDLSGLIEPGSRYRDLVTMFELWVEEIESPSSAGSFAQPLGPDWKNIHASLALKLRGIQRNLGVLPPPAATARGEESGLAVVLRGCRSLVEGMLKELEVMGKVETEVLAREKMRVEDEVRSLVMGGPGVDSAWTPAWQKAT